MKDNWGWMNNPITCGARFDDLWLKLTEGSKYINLWSWIKGWKSYLGNLLVDLQHLCQGGIKTWIMHVRHPFVGRYDNGVSLSEWRDVSTMKQLFGSRKHFIRYPTKSWFALYLKLGWRILNHHFSQSQELICRCMRGFRNRAIDSCA